MSISSKIVTLMKSLNRIFLIQALSHMLNAQRMPTTMCQASGPFVSSVSLPEK